MQRPRWWKYSPNILYQFYCPCIIFRSLIHLEMTSVLYHEIRLTLYYGTGLTSFGPNSYDWQFSWRPHTPQGLKCRLTVAQGCPLPFVASGHTLTLQRQSFESAPSQKLLDCFHIHTAGLCYRTDLESSWKNSVCQCQANQGSHLLAYGLGSRSSPVSLSCEGLAAHHLCFLTLFMQGSVI